MQLSDTKPKAIIAYIQLPKTKILPPTHMALCIRRKSAGFIYTLDIGTSPTIQSSGILPVSAYV